MQRWRRILAAALLLAGAVDAGQPAVQFAPSHREPAPWQAWETGHPALQGFAPRVYQAGTQNWAIVQDARGVLYVGNNDGVLEFDGNRWRLIPVSNRTAVRSLAVDGAGRVHVGALGEIGYLAADATGRTTYVSLLDRIPADKRNFAEVWNTFATPDGVVFASNGRIFRVGAGIRTWEPRTSFHLAFKVGERLFVRERGRGLLELTDGEWLPVPKGERFAEERIYAMLPGPASGDITICTRGNGLFLLQKSRLRRFRTQIDAVLKHSQISSAVRLQDGGLAIGTRHGGLLVLDGQGRLTGRLEKSDGLLDDWIHALLQDHQGGLWMALNKGLARAEVGYPLSSFTEHVGLAGTVLALRRHSGRLFAGTSQGLFRLQGGRGLEPRFIADPVIRGPVWSLLDMDGSLLIAHAAGVSESRGSSSVLVRPSGEDTMVLGRSRRNPARVFVGLVDGLASMRLDDRGWVDEGKIPGVDATVRTLLESEDGSLWMGTQTQGVLRATFPDGWQGGSGGPAPTLTRFGPSEGLPSLNDNRVFDLQGEAAFATHGGLYRFDADAGRFIPDGRFARLFAEGPRWIYALLADADGRIWMHTKDELRVQDETGAAVSGPDRTFTWEATPLQFFAGNWIETIHLDPDGVLWFGGPEGLVRFDPRVAKNYTQPFRTLLRMVAGAGGRALDLGGGSADPPEFKEKAMRFEFAAPSFDGLKANRFQVLLEGVDSEWTKWSTEAYRDYTNLREGSYRFRVRAVNLYGNFGGEGTYSFRILPRWYRHPALLLLWGLLIAAAVFGLYRWRFSILNRRNLELKFAVERATEGIHARELELERLNRRLYQLNDAKNRVIGLAAHDLRNPLAGVLLQCELLLEDARDPELARSLAKIQELGNAMNTLIKGLLDVHAIEAGQAETPRIQPMDLGEVAEKCRDHALTAAAQKGIDLTLDVEGPAPVLGDPGQVGQILDNFLSNALKFSLPCTRVTIQVAKRDSAWRVSVLDQGPGLSPQDLERVFGEYARLSARPTGKESSVGLGLSIVKRLAEGMGGRFGVDSVQGQGATFWLQLPSP